MLSGRVEPVLALVVRRRDFLEDVRLSKKWQGADPQEALKRGRLQLALLPLERRRGPYPRPLSKTISHSKHYRLPWEGAPSGGLAELVSGSAASLIGCRKDVLCQALVLHNQGR